MVITMLITMSILNPKTIPRTKNQPVPFCNQYLLYFHFLLHVSNKQFYFHNLRTDVFASLSFFVTLITAISKSSCVTCIRFSRIANIPASVQTAYISIYITFYHTLHSAPLASVNIEAIFFKSIPLIKFILRL